MEIGIDILIVVGIIVGLTLSLLALEARMKRDQKQDPWEQEYYDKSREITHRRIREENKNGRQ